MATKFNITETQCGNNWSPDCELSLIFNARAKTGEDYKIEMIFDGYELGKKTLRTTLEKIGIRDKEGEALVYALYTEHGRTLRSIFRHYDVDEEHKLHPDIGPEEVCFERGKLTFGFKYDNSTGHKQSMSEKEIAVFNASMQPQQTFPFAIEPGARKLH